MKHFVSCLKSTNAIFRYSNVIEQYYVFLVRGIIGSLNNCQLASTNPTIWIDVSTIYRNDAKTGIQRVVRAVFGEIKNIANGIGFEIKTIAATPNSSYRVVSWPESSETRSFSDNEKPQKGDWFLALDLALHILPKHKFQIALWKKNGVKVAFVIYDILPLSNPEWFSMKLVKAFNSWIRSVAILADVSFCISSTVSIEFMKTMKSRFNLDSSNISTHILPMGSDISASNPTLGVLNGFPDCLVEITKADSALIVGTVEPRKGHQEVLDAFEYLWNKDRIYRLVIVGKPGWLTETIQERILNHKFFGIRLFWFKNATDEMLTTLYRNVSGVIVASKGEGFGLPMLEAKAYGKKIIARNIPVLKEQHAVGVTYFENRSAAGFADEIDKWILDGEISVDYKMLCTWKDTAMSLLAILVRLT